MAAWKKSSQRLVDLFEAALPDDPRVERRPMFGYPAAFTGGNLFASLFEERLVVRLDDEHRESLRALPGAKPFEPMPGRPMKEYTLVPPAMHGRPVDLAKWVARALEYVSTLPPKPRKKAGAKKKARRA
jgi:TfoX/Sxy family transcriptional regulator of competence genes